jgi:chromosome segregation ATPase
MITKMKMMNEDLAAILRTMCVTGICPSQYEEEYLKEAANRLEGVMDMNMLDEKIDKLNEAVNRASNEIKRLQKYEHALEEIRQEIQESMAKVAISKEEPDVVKEAKANVRTGLSWALEFVEKRM